MRACVTVFISNCPRCCIPAQWLSLTSVATNMPTSRLLQAKRAFVRVLLSVAVAFRVTASVNRDSPDDDLLACYRKAILKAHPDKGGSKEQFPTSTTCQRGMEQCQCSEWSCWEAAGHFARVPAVATRPSGHQGQSARVSRLIDLLRGVVCGFVEGVRGLCEAGIGSMGRGTLVLHTRDER